MQLKPVRTALIALIVIAAGLGTATAQRAQAQRPPADLIDTLAQQYPAPVCAPPPARGPFLPDLSFLGDAPIDRLARDYFQDVARVSGTGVYAPVSEAEARALRNAIAQIFEGNPDTIAAAENGEATIYHPYETIYPCVTTWISHINFLTQSRRLLPLAERRVVEMTTSLSRDGQLTDRERTAVQNAIGSIANASGQYNRTTELMRAAWKEGPVAQRAALRMLGFNFDRALEQSTAFYLGYDASGRIPRGAMVYGSYAATRAFACPLGQMYGRQLLQKNPSYAAAFPNYAGMIELCRLEGTLRNNGTRLTIEERRLPSAIMTLEAIGDASGRLASYPGWRQGAIYDQAYAVAEFLRDRAAAQRLSQKADQAVRAKPAAEDALRSGDTIYDSGLWRARLVRLRGMARTNGGADATLNEIIAVLTAMPRTSTDAALRALTLRASSRDARVQAALDRFRRADDAFTRARYAAGSASTSQALGQSAASVAATNRERDSARAALAAVAPTLAAQIASPAPPSIADLRAKVGPDEALIVYSSFPVLGGMAVVVRRDRAVVVDLPSGREDVIRQVGQLRAEISKNPEAASSAAVATSTSWALYQGLMKPLEPHLTGVTRLVIVPDSASDNLPWNALLTQAPAAASLSGAALKDAPWLIQKYAVSVTSSAGTFAALRNTPLQRAEPSFLGVGSPMISASGGGDTVTRLAALPVLGRAGMDAMNAAIGDANSVLVGPAATERAVRQALNRPASVLLFSTHGLFAGAIEGLDEPALVLSSATGPTTPDNDALFKASEIAQLRIPAELVLLTACDTASSSGEVDAETLSGIVRGFYAAGARNVVATYWTASDGFSAQLAEPLAAYLSDRKPLSLAVRDSLNAVRQSADGRYAHPYYWASFGMFGVD